jgi:hypothetical protein
MRSQKLFQFIHSDIDRLEKDVHPKDIELTSLKSSSVYFTLTSFCQIFVSNSLQSVDQVVTRTIGNSQ